MTGHPTLIVCADTEIVRAPLASWLRYLGYELVLSTNGVEMVDHFAEHPASLVMAQLDGAHLAMLGAMARLRELPGGSHVPVLALTAAKDRELARLRSFAQPLGVSGYLPLPIEWRPLVRTLDRFLGAPPIGTTGAGMGPPNNAPEQPSPKDVERAHFQRLAGELRLLGAQDAHARLGLPRGVPATLIRETYFSLAEDYHAELQRTTSARCRELVGRIQERLKEAYLSAKRSVVGAEPTKPTRQAPPAPKPAPSAPTQRPVANTRQKARPTVRAAPEPGSKGDARALGAVAHLATVLGDRPMAVRLLRKVLVLDPRNEDARQQLEGSRSRTKASGDRTLLAILDEDLRPKRR